MNCNPCSRQKLSHKVDIYQVPNQIGGVGADHGLRLRPQQLFKGAVVQTAIAVGGHKIHRRPLPAQAVQRAQDGIVLQVRGDHMVSGTQQAANCDIQGLGGVGGKGHMVRPRAAKQRRGLLADGVDGSSGGEGVIVGAPAAVAVILHGRTTASATPGGLGRVVAALSR